MAERSVRLCSRCRLAQQGGPDTRASWIVAGACFMVTFVTFGLLRCYGLLYVSVLQVFATTREAASWPFSVSAASMNLMGPVAGLLNRRFGCRRVVLVGCATAAAGSAACFLAPNVLYITIAFGIVQGAACGVVMLQVPVTVNQHFIRYRTTAQGIAFSGATIATFIYPPLLEYLVREYGIRGTFLLVGGILLQGAVGGSLVKTPPWLLRKPIEPIRNRSEQYTCVENSSPEVLRSSAGEYLDVKDVNCNSAGRLSPLKPETTEQARPLGNWGLVRSPWEVETEADQKNRELTETLLPSSQLTDSNKGLPRVLIVRSVADGQPEAQTFQLRQDGSSPDSGMLVSRDDALLKPSPPSTLSAFNLIREILADPFFWLLTVSWASFLFAYITYILVIVDCVKDHGIFEEYALFLFSAFSAGDLVGRLGFGWVTDKGYVRRKNFTLCTSSVMGITLVFLPLEWSYAFQMTVSVVIGWAVGSTMILYVSLVADYMRQEQVAMTIGLIGFVNGCLSLLRPSLVGFFRDIHGSYDHLFFTVGALTIICAFTWMFEPFVLRWKKKRTALAANCDTPT